MRVVDIVKIGAEMLKLLSKYDIRTDDYEYLPLYEDYVKMLENGSKVLRILGIERGDMLFVVPLLILNGLTELEAMAGYRKVLDGHVFQCLTSKNVNVFCPQRYEV